MWTATVKLDADKTDVGSATAVWNAGGPDEFTYSKRLKVTVAEGQAFAAEAVAARDEAAARAVREVALSTTLTGFLTEASN